MNMLILPVFATVALAALSPDLGWQSHFLLLVVFVLMEGTGLLAMQWLSQKTEPFTALLLGFVIIAHAMLVADALNPGVHPMLVWGFSVPAVVGYVQARRTSDNKLDASTIALSVFAAMYAFCWSAHIIPEIREFHTSGKFPFWYDVIVHAGTLAQFSEPAELGRGMLVMADMPRPLYHFASYMPAALFPPLADVQPIDAILLIWEPMGILFMAYGCIALGLALGGPVLAALGLMALSAIPDMGRFLLGVGNLLCFDWQLDAAPGTGYSLGVACASLSALILWMRDQKRATLGLALLLAASCFLVRVNIFVWLAPTLALGGVAGLKCIKISIRRSFVVIGLIGLVTALLAYSWQNIAHHSAEFLFGYVDFLHEFKNTDQIYSTNLSSYLVIGGSSLLGAAVILLGTTGWWLILFVFLGCRLWKAQRLNAEDSLPWIFLAVAVVFMFLGPVARNGDITEFRHRPGPLLVIMIMLWSMRFLELTEATVLGRFFRVHNPILMITVAGVSLLLLYTTVGAAKRPDISQASGYYDFHALPELRRLAPLIASGHDLKPRFVIAHQSPKSLAIDDAAVLVALSGVPAFISCPQYLLALGGGIATEARRRMAIVKRLDQASDLALLQSLMRAEGISFYVVQSENEAPFDPQRLSAIGREGQYAVYGADR